MTQERLLTDSFEANRAHLRAVAYRMLGSGSEAEDAVQETWLRLSRAGAGGVDNLGGWLTTVTARICLDMLRSRKSRREDPLDVEAHAPIASPEKHPDDERELADSIGLALLVVLETLSPAERVAYVLHDMFDLPFEDIAPVVGRTPMAARQLASRARRRIQGTDAATEPASEDRSRRKEIVEAFLAASRAGDFAALLELLDPEVVFRADPAAVALGSLPEIRGAEAVANTFKGRATSAQAAYVDDEIGVTVVISGKVRIVMKVAFADDRITALDAVADPDSVDRLRIAPVS